MTLKIFSAKKKKKTPQGGKKNPSVHITWEPYKNYIFPGSYPPEHAWEDPGISIYNKHSRNKIDI